MNTPGTRTPAGDPGSVPTASGHALLEPLARRARGVAWICGGVVVLATCYAVWPVSVTPIPGLSALNRQDRSAASAQIHEDPFNVAAFDAPIWLQPPPPPTPEIAAKPAPPPPPSLPPPAPLKLELLGIIREGDSYRAVIYDPDTDKVAVLAAGDTLAGRTVGKVTADAVAIKDGVGTRTLTLKNAAPPGSGTPPAGGDG